MEFKQHTLNFDTPVVMGILNVTPDSFSDGGLFDSTDAALAQAKAMLEAGAKIIDIGGESTRPGAQPVDAQTEIDRVVPVIKRLAESCECIISIDTSKAEVMRAAVDAGATMINDVCALQQPDALATAAALDVPVCLMHMQGEPRSMQTAPEYDSVVGEVYDFLHARIDACIEAGISPDKIMVDPGFGFGKTLDHNYQLLKHFNKYVYLKVPVLAGMSRKSMIGNVLEQPTEGRLAGSLACAMLALTKGASILRVHDVPETVDIVRIFNKMNSVE
ncbi:MAG: dihydropteroate synthase [Glaciecola sp.]|jgi:dihydropteroate synthase